MTWILVGFCLVGLLDLTPLLRQHKGRATAAFLTVFTVGLTLAVLEVLNFEIPSVMYAWRDLVRWLGLGYEP